MRGSNGRKRPWVAALLSALVTGLGHLYLRRFRRAVGWLAVALVVGIVFVDPAVAEALATGTLSNPLAAWPAAVVSVFSVLDAYVLARTENVLADARARPDDTVSRCPHCGKELDPDLSFCPWCSTELDRPAGTGQSADQR